MPESYRYPHRFTCNHYCEVPKAGCPKCPHPNEMKCEDCPKPNRITYGCKGKCDNCIINDGCCMRNKVKSE